MAQLSPGASLAHCRIVSKLGAGGMGAFESLRSDPRFAVFLMRMGMKP